MRDEKHFRFCVFFVLLMFFFLVLLFLLFFVLLLALKEEVDWFEGIELV